MRIIKCDKCNKEIPNIPNNIILLENNIYFEKAIEQQYDFCHECFEEIEGMVKNYIKI